MMSNSNEGSFLGSARASRAGDGALAIANFALDRTQLVSADLISAHDR